LSIAKPYWQSEPEIPDKYAKLFFEIENSDDDHETKKARCIEAIPDEIALAELKLAFHATHLASTLFGQHGSPVSGIAPNCRGINIPVAYDTPNFLAPVHGIKYPRRLSYDRSV